MDELPWTRSQARWLQGRVSPNPQGRLCRCVSLSSMRDTASPWTGSWRSIGAPMSSAGHPASSSRIPKRLLHDIRVSIEIPV